MLILGNKGLIHVAATFPQLQKVVNLFEKVVNLFEKVVNLFEKVVNLFERMVTFFENMQLCVCDMYSIMS